MSTVSELKLLVHDIVDTNSTTFADARMIRGFNKAQDKVVNLILQKDTLAQWDDENYTDLAEGFLNMVDGQQDYSTKEDENFANLLAIHKIYIKPSATALDTEYVEIAKHGKEFSLVEGVPSAYRLSGKSIIFDVVPNFSATNGIKILFTRIPQPISISDTTKEIGIPTTYHHLIALYVAYDYARAKRMDNRNDILAEIREEEKSLGLFVKKQDFNTNIAITAEPVHSI